MKKVVLIIFVLLTVICVGACKDKKISIEDAENIVKEVEKNMIMEDFSCETNKGTTYELYNRKDKKPVFINFWATWCGPCVAEMPELQDVYNEYKDKVDFIFINSGDSKEEINAFLNESEVKYSFPIGYDLSNEIAMKYEVMAIPTSYIVNKNNEIVDKLIGARSGAEYKRYIEKVLN